MEGSYSIDWMCVRRSPSLADATLLHRWRMRNVARLTRVCPIEIFSGTDWIHPHRNQLSGLH